VKKWISSVFLVFEDEEDRFQIEEFSVRVENNFEVELRKNGEF
jgi:hypothetical protein